MSLKLRTMGRAFRKKSTTNVFRRLYRLEKSRTTPGHGLGLSLVSAIVLLHDGTIELGDNKPGLSVTVTFAEMVASQVGDHSASQSATRTPRLDRRSPLSF